VEDFGIASCNRCHDKSIWAEKKMVYPFESSAPLPHEDIPSEIKPLFEQARKVLFFSPPASCALLRLVIEKILDQIEPGSGTINQKIGKLVQKELDEKIKKALDIVRVIGDNAVHPLHMDLQDDEKTASTLFDIVNIIVNRTISSTKKIDELYSKLPDTALDKIIERDLKNKKNI